MQARYPTCSGRTEKQTLYKLLGLEGSVDAWAVETNYDFTADIEHRDAGLAGFAHGFLGEARVALHVAVFIFDAELIKVLLGGMAKGTPGSGINNNHIHSIAG